MGPTDTAPVTVPLVAEEADLDHWTECHNDNRTRCGLDATDIPWTELDHVACVVCEDLYDDCGCEPDCWCGCPGAFR